MARESAEPHAPAAAFHPPPHPLLTARTPQQVLNLQRALGNRAVGRLLHAGPALQRDIRARGTAAGGTLDVDFKARDPLLEGSRASETGVITFTPGDAAPDTTRIHLEQLAKTETPDLRLPDADDMAIEAQKTSAGHGVEAGFFVDQIVPDIRARIGSLTGALYLSSPARHAYGNTGQIATVPLPDLIARVGKAAEEESPVRDLQRESGISVPQLRKIHDWIVWAREEGFLGGELDAASIAAAMVRTVMKDEVDDGVLSSGTGIDTRIWSDIRVRVRRAREQGDDVDVAAVAKEGNVEEEALRRDAYGFKKGDFRHPASLYDTPSSKYPVRFAFKTAPVNTSTGEDLGIYARWGFEIDRHPEHQRVRIKPSSEFAHVEATEGSTYRATATQARKRFDDYWKGERESALAPPPEHAPPPPPEHAPPPPVQEEPQFRVTGYGSGQLGVFFVDYGQGELVAKPLFTAYKETVAYELGRALGVPQPETMVIPLNAGGSAGLRARAVVDAILESEHAEEYRRSFGNKPPPFLMVMDKVTGITLEKAHDQEVDYGNPTALLNDIGLIAAFDLLLFYRDRTSIVGGGNLANVIIAKGGSGNLRGVAIDQRVNITSGKNFWGQEPLEVVKQKVLAIARGDREVIEGLWDDVPDGLKKALGGTEKGLPLLAASVQRGLRRIASRLGAEAIDRIGHEARGSAATPQMGLSKETLKSDQVDFSALKASLALITQAFG